MVSEIFGDTEEDEEEKVEVEVGELVALMTDLSNNARIRSSAVWSLGDIASRKDDLDSVIQEGGLEALLKLMADPDENVRLAAIGVLHLNFIASGALEPLIKAGGAEAFTRSLNDDYEVVRHVAILGIREMAEAGGAKCVVDAGAVQGLLDLLEDDSKRIGDMEISALQEIAENGLAREEIIAEFIDSLKDRESHVRVAAVVALANSGDPRAVQALEKLLGKEVSSEVKEAAKKALEWLKKPPGER